MPDRGYYLSEDDRRKLNELFLWYHRYRNNTQNRPAVDADTVDGSPETYMALTPMGGLPAAVGTTPGTAKCQPWDTIGGVVVPGLVLQVLNYGIAVSAGKLVPIVRDKFGSWIATSASGARLDNSVDVVTDVVCNGDGTITLTLVTLTGDFTVT
jgi:hypothetical protein